MSRRRTRRALARPARCSPPAWLSAACSTAGDYDRRPRCPPRRRAVAVAPARRPAPRAAPPSGTDVATANCLQSYAPARHHACARARCRPAATWSKIQKRGRLIAGVSADTLLLGARNPISGQIEGFDIDMLHAVSQAIFGDPNKIELEGHHRRPAAAGPPGRQRRHRRAQHDDHLRPLEGDRLLQRVLPLRPEGPGAQGETTDSGGPISAWRTSRARRSAPPTGPPAWTSCAPSRTRGRGGRHPHRLPGAVPAGRGRRHHRRRHRARRAGRPGPLRRGRPGAGLHRRALRPRRQQGATSTSSGSSTASSRTDARRRPVDQELQHLAAPTPWARRRRRPSRSTDGRRDLRADAAPPHRPRRAGSASRCRPRTRCATSRRSAPGATSARPSSTGSTRRPSGPPTQPAYTGDLLLSMALWKAVADRHDLLVATWDSGRVGQTELRAALHPGLGPARRHPGTRRLGAAHRDVPSSSGALAVSLPEACRLSDALAASLRARLGSTRRRPTTRRGCVSCAPRSNGCATSSTASRPRHTRRASRRCSTELDARVADVAGQGQAGRRRRRPARPAGAGRRPRRA